MTGDIDTLRDRIASMSYIAALDDGEREQLLDDVTSLLRDHGLRTHQRLQIPRSPTCAGLASGPEAGTGSLPKGTIPAYLLGHRAVARPG